MRPFLIQKAQALGLGVMDEQVGEVYLPTGEMLCLPGQKPIAHQEDPPTDLPKSREVRDLLYEALLPLLSEHGFKGNKRSGTFKRVFAEGWHELLI